MSTTYLHRINTVEEAPTVDAILIYNLTGGICYINRQDYDPAFAHYWCIQSRFTRKNEKNALTIDLASAVTHSLLFDIDFKRQEELNDDMPYASYIGVIESALKRLFLARVDNFTFLIAVRRDGFGVHVHLPEFIISHDDYIILCQQLKAFFSHTIPGKGRYELDIPTNFMLPGAAKPGQEPYEPMLLEYVDEHNMYQFSFREPATLQLNTLKRKFKRLKKNKDSFFRRFISLEELQNAAYFMLPLPSTFPALHKLSYATLIGNALSESMDEVANFTYTSNSDTGYILKGRQLLFDGSHFQKCQHYLRINADIITNLETSNVALKTWFKRNTNPNASKIDIHPVFHKITHELRENNSKYIRDPHPIKTIMEYNMG